MQTSVRDLYRWIEASHREYGSDPWCFIRELAQNSRDADATRIEVTCGSHENGDEWFTFADNGAGMAWENAQAFLLRLYASSKSEEADYAGTFGVGFWTVLLFSPQTIVIESRSKDEGWGLILDEQLNIKRQPCRLENQGTTISLTRSARAAHPYDFSEKVMERVTFYGRFLQCRHQEKPLQTLCNGKKINTDLSLGIADELFFKTKHLRGVVAVASEPKVELLVKGLPVWNGCTLSDLGQTVNNPAFVKSVEGDFEQAPVFLLDAQKLKVSFTRREVMRDNELNLIVKQAQMALSLYLKKQARLAYPEKWGNRLQRWLFCNQTKIGFFFISLILITPLLLLGVRRLLDQAPIPALAQNNFPVKAEAYGGPAVASVSSSRLPCEISYTPSSPIHLRWFIAGAYDDKTGWFYDPDQPRQELTQLNVAEYPALFSLTLKNFLASQIPFLMPAHSESYRLLYIYPPQKLSPKQTSQSVYTLTIPQGLQTVIYNAYFAPKVELDTIQRIYWQKSPALDAWPPSWQSILQKGQNASDTDRIHLIRRLLTANLLYQTGLTKPRSKSAVQKTSWIDQVLALRRGDCDFINGFAVLLMRTMNLPARLVIGWQGQNGQVNPNLHAWCEIYLEGNWQVLDFSADVRSEMHDVLPSQTTPSLSPFLLTFSLILAGLITMIGLFIIVKNKQESAIAVKPNNKQINEDPNEIRARLLRTARSAVLRPRIWGASSAIWDLRILPSMPGMISLREAISAFCKGRLLAISSHDAPPSVLTGRYSKNRFIVFDGSDTDEICRLLPRNFNLSDLSWHDANLPQSEFLEDLNALLRHEPQGGQKIIEADQLPGAECLHYYDLRLMQGAKRCFGARQLIVLAKNGHPVFTDALQAWEWISGHHCLPLPTLRRITIKLLKRAS